MVLVHKPVQIHINQPKLVQNHILPGLLICSPRTTSFLKNDSDSVCGLRRVLKFFQLILGLSINFEKSELFGFGDHLDSIIAWGSMLGCSMATGNLKYLGVEIGPSPKKLAY